MAGKRKKPNKHVGFWMDVDGEPVHMLADPDMSEETAKALENLVRCVREKMDAKYPLTPTPPTESGGDR